MLEFDIIESSDTKMQIITTLQSTADGKQMYAELCEQQIALRELVWHYITILYIYMNKWKYGTALCCYINKWNWICKNWKI